MCDSRQRSVVRKSSHVLGGGYFEKKIFPSGRRGLQHRERNVAPRSDDNNYTSLYNSTSRGPEFVQICEDLSVTWRSKNEDDVMKKASFISVPD